MTIPRHEWEFRGRHLSETMTRRGKECQKGRPLYIHRGRQGHCVGKRAQTELEVRLRIRRPLYLHSIPDLRCIRERQCVMWNGSRLEIRFSSPFISLEVARALGTS